jgi:prepilin-type N-terminal cleavage/methylation domain-containing protein
MKARLGRYPENLSVNRQLRKAVDGFSLIELMIAMVISTLLLSAVYAVYASLSKSYTTQNVSAEVQQNVRAAIDLMAEDLMMAGLDPDAVADAEFEVATTTNVRFTMDRNLNGTIDESDQERVTYNYNGSSLRQCLYETTASADWETFVDNVTSFSLTYLDGDNNVIASPVASTNLAKIRSVIIDMTVREPAGRDELVERSYTTKVRCRNIGI